MLNDITPLLGDNQQANSMRANVLESMLRSSGIGVNTQFQEILNTLRNPAADSETQQAIKVYNDAIAVQQSANEQLAEINESLATNIADQTAQAIKSALNGLVVNFNDIQLADLAKGIRDMSTVAPGKATGGLIYAAAGEHVSFQPRGTDTVPAMLTPGEFVVNRAATSKNLGLLKDINSGAVRYYADGGYVSDNLTKDSIQADNVKVTSTTYPKIGRAHV